MWLVPGVAIDTRDRRVRLKRRAVLSSGKNDRMKGTITAGPFTEFLEGSRYTTRKIADLPLEVCVARAFRPATLLVRAGLRD